MKELWSVRYSEKEYAYGKEPNLFLKEELGLLKLRKVLFLGEGEGRNAVYAETFGWEVEEIDFSVSGKVSGGTRCKN